jgi:rare lipoprotein A
MIMRKPVYRIVHFMIRPHHVPVLFIFSICLFLAGCVVVKVPYKVIVGTVKGGYYVVKGTYELTAGTTKLVYKVGEFTFKVVKAPMDWAFVNDDIETIDGLSPKEAIRKGRVKTSPYTVKGKKYYPMSVEQSKSYEEAGIAHGTDMRLYATTRDA